MELTPNLGIYAAFAIRGCGKVSDEPGEISRGIKEILYL
jgi:hypothetical protein